MERDRDIRKEKEIPVIKVEGTLKNVEISPEFLEWMAGSEKRKKSD